MRSGLELADYFDSPLDSRVRDLSPLPVVGLVAKSQADLDLSVDIATEDTCRLELIGQVVEPNWLPVLLGRQAVVASQFTEEFCERLIHDGRHRLGFCASAEFYNGSVERGSGAVEGAMALDGDANAVESALLDVTVDQPSRQQPHDRLSALPFFGTVASLGSKQEAVMRKVGRATPQSAVIVSAWAFGKRLRPSWRHQPSIEATANCALS